MKNDVYYLYDGGRLVGRSYNLEKLIREKIYNTKDGKIYYNGKLVYVKNV